MRGVADGTRSTALAIQKTGDALGPTLEAAMGEVRTDLGREIATVRRLQIVSLIAVLLAFAAAAAAVAGLLPKS